MKLPLHRIPKGTLNPMKWGSQNGRVQLEEEVRRTLSLDVHLNSHAMDTNECLVIIQSENNGVEEQHPRTVPPAFTWVEGVEPTSGVSERDRMFAAISGLESTNLSELTELMMTLSERGRALCLSNAEILGTRLAEARMALESESFPDDTLTRQRY